MSDSSITLTLHNRAQAYAIIKDQLYPFIGRWLQAEKKLELVCRLPKRTLDQNAKFHALCDDISKSGVEWAGKVRSPEQWKVLLVSGHASATKDGSEMVPGLEGEFVNLRESTASMNKARGSSLIEYTVAFCALNGIKIVEPRMLCNEK